MTNEELGNINTYLEKHWQIIRETFTGTVRKIETQIEIVFGIKRVPHRNYPSS